MREGADKVNLEGHMLLLQASGYGTSGAAKMPPAE
jgi:hypothetical protein